MVAVNYHSTSPSDKIIVSLLWQIDKVSIFMTEHYFNSNRLLGIVI